MTDLLKIEVLRHLGKPPSQVDRELQQFSDAARALSSRREELMDKYSQQWVGVHQGEVAAAGKTLRSLMAQLEKQGLPREEVIIRFIDRNQRTLIL